ncbi:hypothetical protein [Microbacterium aurum]
MTTPDPAHGAPPPPPLYGAGAPPAAGYPAPSSPPTGWGAPPTGAAASTASRRGLAFTAVVLGALPLVFGMLQPLVLVGVIRAGGYELYTAFGWVLNVLTLVLGIAALACGIAARRDAPLLAGTGIGLGAAATVGAVTGFLFTLTAYV